MIGPRHARRRLAGLEDIFSRFEEAWQAGQQPDLSTSYPPSPRSAATYSSNWSASI